MTRRWHRTCAVLAGLLVLVGLDAGRLVLGAPRHAMALRGMGTFVVAALGIGFPLAAAALFLREGLHRILGARPIGVALLGAVDGAVVWSLGLHLQDPATVRGGSRAALLAAALAVGASLRVISSRSERIGSLLAAASALSALFVTEVLLPVRWMDWSRLTADLVFVVAVARLLGRALERIPRIAVIVPTVAAVGSTLAAHPILDLSVAGRRLLHHGAQHARGWAAAWSRAVDWDRDGASNLFGSTDCAPFDGRRYPGASERAGNGVDENCESGDGRWTKRLAMRDPSLAPAERRDVLIVSLDSLRWDLLGELPLVRAALGAHVEFSRAVSPAPQTAHSLPATFRGRAFRQLRMGPEALVERVARMLDRAPTLAEVLSRAGYDALTVPTHSMLRHPSLRDGFHALTRGGDLADGPRDIVRAEEAFARVRRAAAASTRPLAVWVHLAETHSPYRWGRNGSGPPTLEGLRRSIRALDPRIAAFIRDFARIRASRPVVAVFGDHGEEFGEHGGRFHSFAVYAEHVRVVMLLSSPGVPPGRHDAPVSTAAIPATILDLVGGSRPSTMTVPSLLPPLMDEVPWPDLAVSELRFRGWTCVGYTGERYRLLYDPVHRLEELYDADADPLEQRDLSLERPDLLAVARRRARAWDEAH